MKMCVQWVYIKLLSLIYSLKHLMFFNKCYVYMKRFWFRFNVGMRVKIGIRGLVGVWCNRQSQVRK